MLIEWYPGMLLLLSDPIVQAKLRSSQSYLTLILSFFLSHSPPPMQISWSYLFLTWRMQALAWAKLYAEKNSHAKKCTAFNRS